MTVISIGAWCIIAHYLKSMGLKGPTLPFDWSFSNLRNVIDILSFGICYYLDKEQDLWPKYYINGYNLHYPHHDVSIIENCEMLNRSYQRLKDKINSKERLVFLHFVPYSFDHDIENIEIIRDKILEENPECDFKIVSIVHNETLNDNTKENKYYDLVNIKCTTPWKDDNWCAIDDRDRVERIIRKYNL